jgi:3-hydroxyacyl-[acyl-carrier-protein] dehydratase
MAQVGGILLNKQLNREGQVAYFTSVDNARFRRIVRPGDQLRIEVVFDRVRMGIAKVHGQTRVEGAIASEADLKFGTT